MSRKGILPRIIIILLTLILIFIFSDNSTKVNLKEDIKESPMIITNSDGIKQLVVDGQPFIITGAWAAPQIWTEEIGMPEKGYDLYKDYADFFTASVKCNFTVVGMPIFWSNMEPEKDVYDFSGVDFFLEQAKKNNIKIVLQFIGFNIASGGTFVPPYIHTNPKVYTRIKSPTMKGDALSYILCPNDPDTLEREKILYEKFISHIKEKDTEKSIVMIRYAGEVGYGYAVDKFENIMGSNENHRCQCEICNEKWKSFDLYSENNERENKFMGVSYAKYMNTVIASGKKIYPELPVYTDVINEVTWPGFAYEQDPYLLRKYAPAFDFIGITDANPSSVDTFIDKYLGLINNVPDNLPFISESPLIEARENPEAVGYCDVVEYGGIGGMYFDFTGPIEWMPPDGNGGNYYFSSIVRNEKLQNIFSSYNASYKALMPLIAKYKKTDNIAVWYKTQNANEEVSLGKIKISASSININNNRAFFISEAKDDKHGAIYIGSYNAGNRLVLNLKLPSDIKSVECGYYDNGEWYKTSEQVIENMFTISKNKKSIILNKTDINDYKSSAFRIVY